MGNEVRLSRQARKDLEKVPNNIQKKFHIWVDYVEEVGILETRKFTGFRDKALKGNRRGQQ